LPARPPGRRRDHEAHASRQRHAVEARQQRAIGEQHAILRLRQQQDDRLGRQAGIDRVQDGAHAGHGEIELEMMLGVPRQGGDAIALAHTELGECCGEPAAALEHLAIGRRDERSWKPRRHGLGGIQALDALAHQIERQRHVLHQAPDHARSLTAAAGGINNFSKNIRL